jgi:hypothetical protein
MAVLDIVTPDASSDYTGDVHAPEADYGRSSIEMRPNERSATGERQWV